MPRSLERQSARMALYAGVRNAHHAMAARSALTPMCEAKTAQALTLLHHTGGIEEHELPTTNNSHARRWLELNQGRLTNLPHLRVYPSPIAGKPIDHETAFLDEVSVNLLATNRFNPARNGYNREAYHTMPLRSVADYPQPFPAMYRTPGTYIAGVPQVSARCFLSLSGGDVEVPVAIWIGVASVNAFSGMRWNPDALQANAGDDYLQFPLSRTGSTPFELYGWEHDGEPTQFGTDVTNIPAPFLALRLVARRLKSDWYFRYRQAEIAQLIHDLLLDLPTDSKGISPGDRAIANRFGTYVPPDGLSRVDSPYSNRAEGTPLFPPDAWDYHPDRRRNLTLYLIKGDHWKTVTGSTIEEPRTW